MAVKVICYFSVFDLNHYFNCSLGPVGQSIEEWINIDANLMLFVFLPPLIFGEAMSLNWYHVKGGFFQSVILAGPGVLLGAVLMGVLTKYILPYNWSWSLAMTFGIVFYVIYLYFKCGILMNFYIYKSIILTDYTNLLF